MHRYLFRIATEDNQTIFVIAENPGIAAGFYVIGEADAGRSPQPFTIAVWGSQLAEGDRQGLSQLISEGATGIATFDPQKRSWALSQPL
jgi:hypothetical protein